MKSTIFLFIIFIFFSTVSFSQSSAKKEVQNDRKLIQKEGSDFGWKVYDTKCKISIDSIRPEIVQGIWKAYYGFFKFGDMINSMNLTQPFIIEINSDKMRRSADLELEPFTLNKNQLTSNDGKDNGYINKITETLLIITWENDGNFTRYYYSK